jgi:hypothetical protein|tara:strand:- start:97 stop:390 length:294 start_codon:yes stop_codon:yes gene_type:complete
MSNIIFTPTTTQAALGTNTGAASNVGSSEFVRLINSGDVNTEYLVTLEESGGTDIGTFTLGGHESVIIRKAKTDKLFAENAAILACGVSVVSIRKQV